MKTIFVLIAMAAVCSPYKPVDVEEAFLENDIVPDMLENAPKKIINVSNDDHF